jgi:hypothetical protein
MILPSRHFTYPEVVEEVEKGALEVMIQPRDGEPFLATCALGFRDPAAPTGVWATPHSDWLCAVSGGYAYLIDTAQPEQFTMIRYRPVLQVIPYHSGTTSPSLLLFAGHNSILAWGPDGEAWESGRLSWEGLTQLHIEGEILSGLGWDLMTDKDVPFALDLRSGKRL